MSIDGTLLEDPSSSHRIYIGDSIGCLRVAQCDPPSSLPDDYAGPSVQPIILPNFKSHSDHAVQRIATGVLEGGVYVVALARKNATIDVVHIINQSLPSTSSAPAAVSELRANIICTIHETKMKAGVQRFIGLAVGSQGVYSVTSSGVFRFTRLTVTGSGSQATAQLGEAKILDNLPSPLQHTSFSPASNPTHFCYGGEDIPLSLWHIPTAVSEPPAHSVADMSVESIKSADDVSVLNSKQRKRKRQLEAKTKARELMWGEVWRAKNLPNDNLSLPRRANITATCMLALHETDDGAVAEESFIAVGTKDGLVRIYAPGSASRKHVREIRVVPAGQGAVKTLCCSSSPLDSRTGGILFVGDTGSKLYAVDWQTGAVLYSYKGQVGATLSMTVLPLPSSTQEALLSVSSDSLIRLHTIVAAASAVPKPAMSAEKGRTVWEKMITPPTSQSVSACATAVVWDALVPTVSTDHGDDDQDEVWAAMQAVSHKQRHSHEQQDHDDDDDDDQESSQERQQRKLPANQPNQHRPRRVASNHRFLHIIATHSQPVIVRNALH